MSYTQTLECLVAGLGQATGEAIRTEIDALLGLPNVDLQALQQAVAQIQALLDANPSEAGFQVGQNIITQLVALGNRLDALENSTVVAQLQVLVGQINAGLAQEVADRQAADQLLQDAITALGSQVDSIASQVASIVNQTGDTCDCAAIAAQITGLETAISNLTGTDAAQAAQIAGLQTQLATLSGQVSTAITAAAAAQAAADAAATAAAAATAVANANAVAIAALDERENGRHNGHGGRLTALEAFQAEVNSADCAALVASFRANITVGLTAPSGY